MTVTGTLISEHQQTAAVIEKIGLRHGRAGSVLTPAGEMLGKLSDITDAMFAVGWLTKSSADMAPHHPVMNGVGAAWHRIPRLEGNTGEFNISRCIAELRYGLAVFPLAGHNSYEFFCRRIPVSKVAGMSRTLDSELMASLLASFPKPVPYGAMGYISDGHEHGAGLNWNR